VNVKQSLLIVALCVAAAVVYGVVHDQITVRLCLEYFSKTHPHLIDSHSPTLLALAWGVVATWWVGLGLGAIIILAARLGRWPKVDARDILRPVLILLAIMATLATLSGFAGFHLSSAGQITLPPDVELVVPAARHHHWMGVWYAHNASYDVGFIGGVVIAVLVVLTRRRRARVLAGAGHAKAP
jgi:hypothetical protein